MRIFQKIHVFQFFKPALFLGGNEGQSRFNSNHLKVLIFQLFQLAIIWLGVQATMKL